jgi:hypothetical protein
MALPPALMSRSWTAPRSSVGGVCGLVSADVCGLVSIGLSCSLLLTAEPPCVLGNALSIAAEVDSFPGYDVVSVLVVHP